MCEEIIRAKGNITRIYHYSLNTKQGLNGRLFGLSSIQGVPREIRGLVMKHTTDIDMKNAHPVILVYLCKSYGYACPEVQYYVNNREAILSQMPNRNEGKLLYLKALNKNTLAPEINAFSREVIKLQKLLMANPDFADNSGQNIRFWPRTYLYSGLPNQ